MLELAMVLPPFRCAAHLQCCCSLPGQQENPIPLAAPPFVPQAAAAAGLNTSHLAPAAGGQQGAGELPPAWGVDPAVLESSSLHYAPLAYSMGERCGVGSGFALIINVLLASGSS